MFIPVADYAPDIADLNSNFSDTVNNVLCASGLYLPMPSLQALTQALPSRPLGWLSVRTLDGTIRFFAATGTKLYLLNSGTLGWDDVSKPATTYGASIDVPWCIKAFGNFIIAVNQNDNPQVFQIGTDVKFRDLGGSPPRAGLIEIWGDFVALMKLTSNSNRVQWSGLNNCEFWTPGSSNSDFQDFPDGGQVQASTEVTNPVVLLETAIYLATFVPGSTEIFTFQKIQDKRGARAPMSVATRGSICFYVDVGGFFQVNADGSIIPIGLERVDKTVLSRLTGYGRSRILGVVDPVYNRVYFAIDYDDNGTYDQMVVYDWTLQKWTTTDLNVVGVFQFATAGYTLDGLDAVSSSLDALPFSLDSKVWDGGAPVLGAFTTDFKIGAFSGASLEATVVTQEAGDTAGQIMRTTSTTPVIDTSNVYVSLGVRFRRSDNVTWLPEQIPSSHTGKVRKNSRARFHRVKMRVPAGATWKFMKGVDVDTTPAGGR